MPDLSRSQVQRLIKDGMRARARRKAPRASMPVHAGQTFTVDVPEPSRRDAGCGGPAAAHHSTKTRTWW